MPQIAVLSGSSRTAKYLVPQALVEGHQVRAVVRSAKRVQFSVAPSKKLQVIEVPSMNSVKEIASAISGVDAVYITVGGTDRKPTTLQQDTVQTLVAAIRLNSPTPPPRIIMLSSSPLAPHAPNMTNQGLSLIERFLARHLLYNLYYDQQRAQEYLEKQSSWLESAFIHPGGLVDVPESDEVAQKGFKLSLTELPEGKELSYTRLAAAMLAMGQEWETYGGKHVAPMPGDPVVKAGLKEHETIISVLGEWVQDDIIKPTIKYGLVAGAGAGAVIGLQQYGVI